VKALTGLGAGINDVAGDNGNAITCLTTQGARVCSFSLLRP
jgi:hypothetical protein